MKCASCQRMNLPGGVRCVYCGTPLPPAPDFEMGIEEVGAQPLAPSHLPDTLKDTPPSDEAGPPKRAVSGGLVGVLIVLLLKAKSLLALLKFGKLATTLGSMFVFIWADAKLFGWKFGVGVALCILVHELGHVVVNWRKGLKQSAPTFIPFLGAVIFVKQFPEDPTVESESGAGGPTAGLLAAVACALVAAQTGSRYWLALAHFGFVINLFNLIPFPILPLDGVRIASVFSPATWNLVLVALLLWVLKVRSPMLWVVMLVGFLFRLGRPEHGRHLLAAPTTRLRMAALYLGLCLSLGYGVQHSGGMHSLYASSSTQTARGQAEEPKDEGQ